MSIVHPPLFKTIQEFDFIKEGKAGSGSFGQVLVAMHKTTNRLYAVKVISSIPSDVQAKLIERQIQIHRQLDHPHLVKLWDTLIEEGKIFMIMEFAQSGNLFYHQNAKATFTQPEAFRFFNQTLQGVQYLHNCDIIHRDLKPQNLLLDADFNIKICDFGWAAQDIHLQRNTFCGTYEYMAPQMLFQESYDYRVDVWALGVLLYELLHGHAPFKGSSSAEVQDSLLKGGYPMNTKLSKSVKDLIEGILQVQPEKRLSFQEINNHPWVKSMQKLINTHLQIQKVKSPKNVYPTISKIKDTKQSIHKKNSSLNLVDQKKKNHQDNNKIKIQQRNARNQTSQSKFRSHERDQPSPKKLQHPIFKKNKPIQSQNDLQRLLSRIRNKKISCGKDGIMSIDQPLSESTNKRKVKNNISQVDILADKYPVRFNTEADSDWEPNRLKKNHLNAKMLNFSRSLKKTRLQTKF